jgi:replicative superfamily II helicase
MGINLNIGRVIFSAVEKNDGFAYRLLTPPEIKQIAGRAGRFGSEHPVGYAGQSVCTAGVGLQSVMSKFCLNRE